MRMDNFRGAPSLPIAKVRTLDDYYRESMARTSFTRVMLLVAGGIALLLDVVGLSSPRPARPATFPPAAPCGSIPP
jgi:hypothetical protein